MTVLAQAIPCKFSGMLPANFFDEKNFQLIYIFIVWKFKFILTVKNKLDFFFHDYHSKSGLFPLQIHSQWRYKAISTNLKLTLKQYFFQVFSRNLLRLKDFLLKNMPWKVQILDNKSQFWQLNELDKKYR